MNRSEEALYRQELTSSTISLVQLAELKGFKTSESIKSIMLAEWMPVAEIFANTVCAALQWWLRTEYKVIVWIEPADFDTGTWRSFIRFYGANRVNPTNEHYHSYELELISGLEFAINSLPPAVQEHG